MGFDLSYKAAIIVMIRAYNYAIFCMSQPNAVSLSDFCSGRGCSVLCVIQPPAVAALWDGGAGDGGSILFSKSARVSILRHGFLIPAIPLHLKSALIGKGYIEDFSLTFRPYTSYCTIRTALSLNDLIK